MRSIDSDPGDGQTWYQLPFIATFYWLDYHEVFTRKVLYGTTEIPQSIRCLSTGCVSRWKESNFLVFYWCFILPGILLIYIGETTNDDSPKINQYRDALDAYSRAIRLNPYLSEVWYDLGTLYESCNNQISDALDAYQRAAELDPHNKHILVLLETCSILLCRFTYPAKTFHAKSATLWWNRKSNWC